MCTAVLDWSLQEMVGFSAFVSIGSMLDVDWGDLITYFGNDPRTDSIVIYMESIGDPRSFLSAAREVSMTKPIIVIKAGRTAAAAKAAASHTGSLTGSDAVSGCRLPPQRACCVSIPSATSSICRKCWPSSRVRRPATLHRHQRRWSGRAGDRRAGTGRRRTRRHFGGNNGEVQPVLPDAWSHNNPVDILGDAEPERYSKSLEIAAQDPSIDGMLVIMTPQGMTDPTRIAENLKPYAQSLGKPVLASWMGGIQVKCGEEILNRAGIPTFAFPDAAAEAFNYMWKYSYNLRESLRDSDLSTRHVKTSTAEGRRSSSSMCARRAARS